MASIMCPPHDTSTIFTRCEFASFSRLRMITSWYGSICSLVLTPLSLCHFIPHQYTLPDSHRMQLLP